MNDTGPLPAGFPTWPAAAADLAARATRRARLSAFIPRLAAGMALGAACAIAVQVLGFVALPAPAFMTLFTGAGLVLAARAAARVPAVSPGDAAWALDRVAGASERGLTAATATGPAASEAAWSGTPVPPPSVRLKPPAGVVALAATCLLAVTASVWPARTARAGDESRAAPGPRAAGSAADGAREAAAAETRARAADRAAAVERSLREALDLPTTGKPDPATILKRLEAPDTATSVRKALPPGSDAARALEKGDAAKAAEAMARALSGGGAAAAEEARREAAEARAASAVAPVAPERRALVERYLSARLAQANLGDGR